MGARDKKRV